MRKNGFLALMAALLILAATGCNNGGESSSAVTSASKADTESTPAVSFPDAEGIITVSAETDSVTADSTELTADNAMFSDEATSELVSETEEELILSSAAAETNPSETAETDAETLETTEPSAAEEPSIGLYRADTMECLYQQKDDVPIYPASLTKVLTAATALKYVSPDTVYTVGTELALVQPHSSLCLIQMGHRLTLYDLLTGMLMNSGNDAAYTVAVNVARDVSGNPDMSDREAADYFVGLMNEYAAELGARNSHFTTPDGWDDPNQQTTVHDLALFSACAMQHDEIREIAGTPIKDVIFESGEYVTWYNTNALIHPEYEYYLPQAVGLKTGTTDLAGKCLIAVIDIDGREYIAVTANCRTNEERYGTIFELTEMITAL